MHIMTGNLSHQIEHHLFPDLPSNRYAEIAPTGARDLQRYGLSVHHRLAAPSGRVCVEEGGRVVAAQRLLGPVCGQEPAAEGVATPSGNRVARGPTLSG